MKHVESGKRVGDIAPTPQQSMPPQPQPIGDSAQAPQSPLQNPAKSVGGDSSREWGGTGPWIDNM